MATMRPNRILTLLLAASWVCLGSPSLQAETSNGSCGGKEQRLLKEAGYTYNTHSETTYSVDLDRKNLGKFRVIVACGSGLVVTFAILAKKSAIQKTPRLMEILLFANHEYDRTKILLDKDGDLAVRVDTPVRLIDATQLKDDVGQVASVSNELFPKISAFIKR
jgi:hypothetical protein